MTKQTYVFRTQAAKDAERLGYVGFRTWLEDDLWRLSYTHNASPAQEWLLRRPAERRDFVHHCEVFFEDGHVVPVLVVNVTKDELSDEGEWQQLENGRVVMQAGDDWFMVEPICGELWQTREEKITERINNRQRPERAKSTASSPTRLVWEIAESMPDAPKADVVAACVGRGINKSTASTQYYHWRKAREEKSA